MIITLYKNLIKDYDSKKITLMGDSAGANISLIAAQQFKIKKMPPPAHIILLSPPVNLDASKEIMSKLFIDDKVLSTKLMEVCAE
ncbi:hypothetical protein FACS189459_4730 [Bacilli bacterium]|nr:hypothetical protein FACS189459_4730 [Bacilli bacterium]